MELITLTVVMIFSMGFGVALTGAMLSTTMALMAKGSLRPEPAPARVRRFAARQR